MPTLESTPVPFEHLNECTYKIQQIIHDKKVISHKDLMLVLHGLINALVELDMVGITVDNEGEVCYFAKRSYV